MSFTLTPSGKWRKKKCENANDDSDDSNDYSDNSDKLSQPSLSGHFARSFSPQWFAKLPLRASCHRTRAPTPIAALAHSSDPCLCFGICSEFPLICLTRCLPLATHAAAVALCVAIYHICEQWAGGCRLPLCHSATLRTQLPLLCNEIT